MLQSATPLRKSPPWPPNISDEHVSCTAPATRNASSSGATNHLKNTVNCDFSTFLRTCIFCLLTLSLFWSSFFFSSLILPTSAFSSVHIVGSLTSKLPSIICNYFNCHKWLPALKQARSQNLKLPAAQALQWPPSSYPSQPTFVHENMENTAVICCRLKILLVTQGPLQPSTTCRRGK